MTLKNVISRFTTVLLKPLCNAEDIVVFLGLKVLYSDNSYLFSAVKMRREPSIEYNQFSKLETVISKITHKTSQCIVLNFKKKTIYEVKFYIKTRHRKSYKNFTHFDWSNKDCKQMSSSLINKGIFSLMIHIFNPNPNKSIDELKG